MIRKHLVTAHGRTLTGRDAYNEAGELLPITDMTFTFKASIQGQKSPLQVDYGKRRDTRIYELNADTRSIANLTIDHYLTINGDTKKYQVVDIFDGDISGIDFDSTILAKYIK